MTRLRKEDFQKGIDELWDACLMSILNMCDAVVPKDDDGTLVYAYDAQAFQKSYEAAQTSLMYLHRMNPDTAAQLNAFIDLEILPIWEDM